MSITVTAIGAANNSTGTVTLSSANITQGNAILVLVYMNSNTTTVTGVSDNVGSGNTFTSGTLFTEDASWRMQAWWALDSAAITADVIKVVQSGTVAMAVHAYQVSGITGVDTSSQVSTFGASSSTSFTTPSFSTVFASEVTFLFGGTNATETWTTGTAGYTIGPTNNLTGSAWQIWSSTQSSITGTLDIGGSHAGLIMAISLESNVTNHTQSITSTQNNFAGTTAKQDTCLGSLQAATSPNNAALAKQDNKSLAAASNTNSAALVRQTQATGALQAAGSPFVATVAKSFSHVWAAVASSFAGTTTRTGIKAISAATLSNAASVARTIGKNLTAAPVALAAAITKRVSRSFSAIGLTFAGLVGKIFPMSFLANNPTTWGNGYQCLTTVTINNRSTGISLTNFPVLISLSTPNLATTGNGGVVQTTGNQTIGAFTMTAPFDFLVTSDPQGLQPIAGVEFVEYDHVAGAAIFFVNIASLNPTGNQIFIWYGNPGVTTLQGTPSAVWNSFYLGVYHLANGSVLYLDDSTTNGNYGTGIGSPTPAQGPIWGGATLTASQSITTQNTLSPSTTTISCWVNIATLPTQNINLCGVVASSKNGPTLGLNSSGQPIFFNNSATPFTLTGSTALTTNTWHHLAATNTSTLATLYLDGVQVGQISASNLTTGFTGPGFQIGGAGEWSAGAFKIDEVKITNHGFSTTWISAEYANQNSPSTFYSVSYDQTAVPLPMNAGTVSKSTTIPLLATAKQNAVSLSKTTTGVWQAAINPLSAGVQKATQSIGQFQATMLPNTVSFVKTTVKNWLVLPSAFAGKVTKTTSHAFNATMATSSATVSKLVSRSLSAISALFNAVFIGDYSDTRTQNQTGISRIINATLTYDLSPYFNALGITTDGFTYSSGTGIFNSSTTLSATEVGSALTVGPANVPFLFGTPNTNNVIIGSGIPLPVPQFAWTKVCIVALAYSSAQTNQSITATYEGSNGIWSSLFPFLFSGITEVKTYSQSFSVLNNPQGYTGENQALTMSYIDTYLGGQTSGSFYLYEYEFALDPTKTLLSITLPNDPNIATLAVTFLNAPTQNISGVSRIQVTTAQTITGAARLQITTVQTITGNAEIRGTTDQTISGTTRVQVTTSKTQNAVSRVRVVTNQTITGNAAIAGGTVKTQTGVARILAAGVTKTQSAVSRIQIATIQTLNGKARIRVSTVQNQDAVSRIETVSSKTQTGVARLQVTTVQTISGTSRIHVVGFGAQSLSGTTRVRVTTVHTQDAVSRIQISTIRTQNAVSRIQTATVKNQSGKAKIRAITTQTMDAVSRVQVTTVQTISGTSRISHVAVLQNQTGVARIETSSTQTQTGVSRIQHVGVTQTQDAVSRIQITDVRNLSGVSRIEVTTTKTQNGVGRIFIVTTQTIDAVSRIRVSTLRTMSGTSRIRVTTQQGITGHSMIVRNPHVHYVQRNATNRVKRNAPIGSVLRRMWERIR